MIVVHGMVQCCAETDEKRQQFEQPVMSRLEESETGWPLPSTHKHKPKHSAVEFCSLVGSAVPKFNCLSHQKSISRPAPAAMLTNPTVHLLLLAYFGCLSAALSDKVRPPPALPLDLEASAAGQAAFPNWHLCRAWGDRLRSSRMSASSCREFCTWTTSLLTRWVTTEFGTYPRPNLTAITLAPSVHASSGG